MNNQQRLAWVDTAKGISIILVVMMYAAYSTGEATGTPGFMHYIIGFATPFRMPEFFLISGLFLSRVIARGWRRYADRRLVHYFYFYGLWALILITFKVALFSGAPLEALSWLAWAIIEPYSVLWFIYMLAIVSLVAKLLHALRAPHWAVLGAAALLQIAPVQTPSYIVNQFSEYFVYFYTGYVFAPAIFKLAGFATGRPAWTAGLLAAWGLINGALVFWPGYSAQPGHFEMGLAALPGLRLILAIAGALAICLTAALLSRLAAMDWLRWLGARSIVVYLAFLPPMAITREMLLRFTPLTDTGLISLIVLIAATLSPVVLYLAIQRTGWGKFLFERPAWAHLPGTSGHSTQPAVHTAAAE